ncbi:nuclease-related domain-containing protein [Neobacillus massiliamazoniensis]|uniref:Nerd domain protein n=1 Tax=Neobacillus massiliamazoniensis TaxID=1499688 RepID=A0A0U1NTU0_9BACI|nr:nuclease-related domain-containing protein [Neobacillus massiliamazoniensis]CRK81385.1 nerd domain protein [Neobacillus massiliamazoniensis]
MILKDLTPPDRLILTERLERRLIIGHHKHSEVERSLAKRRAGYWGEITLNKFLKELPQSKYHIFHDLQLQIEGVHFQIDALLLTKYYILIIEAKNIIGPLTFDSIFKQLIRNQDGKEEIFEDPRVQAKYHQILLNRWLRYHGFNLLPVEHLVFFSSHHSYLKTKPSDTSDFSKVCKAREIFLKINDFENEYRRKKIDQQAADDLGNFIISQHTPKTINILEEFHLTTKNIRTGTCCPNCSFTPMIYVRGIWSCPSCKQKSKDAHLEGIGDYLYLIKPTITNSEFREFFHLPNNNVPQKMLQSSNLNSSGKTKNRYYFF